MNNNKRNLLKVLSVAGAAGAVWKKPVVDAVSLPAHAATTVCLRCFASEPHQVSYRIPENSEALVDIGGIQVFNNAECGGGATFTTIGILARTQAEADANFSFPNNCPELFLSLQEGCQYNLYTNDC